MVKIPDTIRELYSGRDRVPLLNSFRSTPGDKKDLIQKAVNKGDLSTALSVLRSTFPRKSKELELRLEDVVKESTIRSIASTFNPKIQSAVIRAFDRLKNAYSLPEIEAIFSQGGIAALNTILGNAEDIFTEEIRPELDGIFLTVGRQSILILPPQAIIAGNFTFDPFNRNSAEYLRDYEFKLIQGISDTTREAVQNTLRRQVITGINPREAARQFRDNIGLTPFQEKAVSNYENNLRNLKGNALRRALRDKRFDPTVLRAITDKRPLSEDQIQNMTGRYRERYVKYRAEVIARTESLRACSIAQEEGIKQLVSLGGVDTERMRSFWLHAWDSRVRDAHRQIPKMNKEGIRVGEFFKTLLGPLEFPRDPRGTAANTVQCRCAKIYRFID